jgi:hypothetical protein
VYTIIETPVYAKKATALLDEEERESLAAFIELHPMSGSVIPRSGGIRKLRWRSTDGGKRGGHRVIYFNRLPQGLIWLLTIFSKRQQVNLSMRELILIQRAVNDGK